MLKLNIWSLHQAKLGRKKRSFSTTVKQLWNRVLLKKWCNTEVNMTWMKHVASIRFKSMYFKELSFMISRLISSVCSIFIWIQFIFNLLGLFIFRVFFFLGFFWSVPKLSSCYKCHQTSCRYSAHPTWREKGNCMWQNCVHPTLSV